jgi:lipopolysaccharide biosynthesis protein
MIAVLVHIFYTDVWNEIFPLLLPIKDQIHIDISLYEKNDNSKILEDLKNFHIIKIRYMENVGVDIGPFLFQINELDENTYPYFIKLHSKKSFISKLDWKHILFHTLVGSSDILNRNKNLLDSNSNMGAITDPVTIMTNIGKNQNYINVLSKLLNIKTSKKEFMAGSMFMSRTKIFKKYFTSAFVNAIYPLLETGKVSDREHGTYCHGLERIFGKIISNENLQIGYRRDSPTFSIYSKHNRTTYNIHKCYNNYCYTRSNKQLVFGYVYPIINDDSIVINWTYMKQYDNFLRRYDKQINGTYIGVS